jgi:hypothetical protein
MPNIGISCRLSGANMIVTRKDLTETSVQVHTHTTRWMSGHRSLFCAQHIYNFKLCRTFLHLLSFRVETTSRFVFIFADSACILSDSVCHQVAASDDACSPVYSHCLGSQARLNSLERNMPVSICTTLPCIAFWHSRHPNELLQVTL